MRVACLILAYSGAPVLARSLPTYHAAGWDVFVHLDTKVDAEQYRQVLGTWADACHFIEPRTTVFWAGYSMVSATLALIGAAQARHGYDRFVLLSDDTMPIYPAGHLNTFLAQHGDLITAVLQGPGSKNYADYQKFFFLDHPVTNPRSTAPRSGEIDESLQTAVQEIAELRRTGKKSIPLYYGSQFWCLTSQTMQTVLDVLRRDQHLARSFKFTAFSDEMLFQSIAAQHVFNGYHADGPVYADFHSDPGRTRVFASAGELPFDLHPHHLFVRKVSPTAHDFLDLIASRLARGLTIYGVDQSPRPAGPGASILIQSEHQVAVRLSAPVEPAGSAAWNGIERHGDKRFRWTGHDVIEWRIRLTEPAATRVCFFIPVVMAKPGFLEQCRLGFQGQQRPMIDTRYSLAAEFSVQGVTGEAVVTLHTPPAVEAARGYDSRLVGIAVEL